ncbi:MAG: YraN family protein [Pseudomonadota bacterium]
MTDRDRRGAERRGRHAETLAAAWLTLKGYHVLASRVRLPVGEIDLIARRRTVLAFVEVKQRAHLHDALQAVTPRAWDRISRAAEVWASSQPHASQLDWRFDLVAITPLSRPRHFRDYWRP